MKRVRITGVGLAALAGLSAATAAMALELEPSPDPGQWDRLGATTSTTTSPFAVRNVYALPGATKPTQVKVGRLIVFGDSFSDANFASGSGRPYSNWAQKLVQLKVATTLEDYAVSGSKARDDNGGNRLSQQVDRFLATDPTYAANDLAVVFIGYNDVGFRPNLEASEAGFQTQVKRLLDTGLRNNYRRLFVPVLFDNSKAPGNGTFPSFTPTRDNVKEWKSFLEDYGNRVGRVVLVDLFTAFDRVFTYPDRFGLTNVTTADPDNSGTTALWDDDLHFGSRGHSLIAQVFRHYLTRGWDWANTLAKGPDQVRRLKKDIDAGLVMRLDGAPEDGAPMLQAFPVGDAYWHAAALDDTTLAGGAGPADGGWGMDLRLDADTRIGLVLAQYDDFGGWSDGGASSSSSADARSYAVYLDHRLAGFALQSLVAFSDQHYVTSSSSDLTAVSGHGSFDGRTLTASQRVGRPLEVGDALVTPWLELAHTRQSAKDYTTSDPLVSDTTYSVPEIGETSLALGLDAVSPVIPLGNSARLQLRGGLALEASLDRDDYEITMRETAFDNYSYTETVPQEQRRSLSLSLGAAVAVGDTVRLDLGYGATDDSAAGLDHALRFNVSWRF